MTRTSLPASTSSNASVNLPSRSRIRKLKRSAGSPRSISRLRACWAVQAPAGWAVTPRICTRRVSCLLRRYRLDPCDLTDLFGGALVVDVGEIGGDEAAVVRFTLCGEILPSGDAVTAAR